MTAIELSLSVGEGIPYTSYCLDTENKNSTFGPYMGTYVSGTPVKGGARTPYFTMRSQASFTRRSAAVETPNNLLLPFVTNTFRIIFYGFINAHFTHFTDCTKAWEVLFKKRLEFRSFLQQGTGLMS